METPNGSATANAAEATSAETPPPLPNTVDEAGVKKIVEDAIIKDRQTREAQAAQAAERETFTKGELSGLAKLPPIYQKQLGPDKSKWPEEAKAIVKQFESDFHATGMKLPTIGGANRDGGTTAINDSGNTRSGSQLIAAGLGKRRN